MNIKRKLERLILFFVLKYLGGTSLGYYSMTLDMFGKIS